MPTPQQTPVPRQNQVYYGLEEGVAFLVALAIACSGAIMAR